MSNVHVVRETNLHNIPATLRNIAEAIEAGRWGDCSGAVVVVDSRDDIFVSYMGQGEAGPNALVLLHAGAHKMMHGVMEGKENG